MLSRTAVRLSLSLSVLLLVLFPLFLVNRGSRTAEVVLLGGMVYTMDASRSWAEAVAFSKGRILYVGSDAGARTFVGSGTRVLHLNGNMILPGFRDSHIHPVTGGLLLSECRLDDLATAGAILAAIREFRSRHPEKKWLTGSGWDLHVFADANPRKEALDAIVGDVPSYFESVDGHSAWANSAALRLGGIDSNTADPPGGRIERDAVTGMPTGTLRESAMKLVAGKIPAPSPQDRLDGLRSVLQQAARFGITALHEANATPDILDAYSELSRRSELTASISASLHFDRDRGEADIPELARIRSMYNARNLQVNAVKLFMDGVIESHTAALLESYLDRPGDSGPANYTPQVLNRLAVKLDAQGFQLHMHAIGDRAVRMALDACEAALIANGNHDSRHHIAHNQLIDPADIPRFAKLRVIADFEALWAYPDSDITELTEPRLGPVRSRWLYPIGSVAATGAVMVGGSDWSVTSMNPLEAIQVAVTRAPLDSKAKPWIPEELTDVRTMLAAYTINGAYLNHEEKETGSIEAGKRADLIVLNQNLFSLPKTAIHNAKVLLTLFNGREVYRDPSFRD